MMENINIKKKIIKFVKYHNAFVIMMVLAFVGIGGVFANEDIRDAVVGEEVVVEIKGIDNSAILACDLEAFDAMMRIVDVTGDTENYFVEYTYQTLAIEDNAWQEIARQETLDISKAALEGRELGLYLIEELGEIVESELAFLKEVQENEMTKGETEVVEIIDTTGLLGLLSDIIIKYKPEPVAPVVAPAPAPVVPIAPIVAPAPAPIYGCMDSTALNYDAIATEDNGSCQYPVAAPEPVCAADNIGLCDTQDLCETAELYWYNDICNTVAEQLADEPPTGDAGDGPPADICAIEHLNLCLTESDCLGALGFWYNGVCNSEAETPAEVCDADHIDLCVSQEKCAGIELYWYNDVCNLEAQNILGCIDATALNYNAEATQDDGSCEFPEPEPLTCAEFTYSEWGECQADGTQTRTILTSLPDGCVDGSPILSQPCDYEPEPEPVE